MMNDWNNYYIFYVIRVKISHETRHELHCKKKKKKKEEEEDYKMKTLIIVFTPESFIHVYDFCYIDRWILTMAEGDIDSRFPLKFEGPKAGVKYPIKVQYVEGEVICMLSHIYHS